jgi:uncharacterized protein
VITINVVNLQGAWEKVRGLMFSKSISPVYFETRFGVHTFFVNFPIDVVILDANNIVCELKQNLSPWRVFLWNPKYFRVIETPDGFVKLRKIMIGTKIKLSFKEKFRNL